MFNALYLPMIWFGLPWLRLGLEVVGVAFLMAYVIHFTVLTILVRRLHGFRWQRLSTALLGVHGGLAVALLLLARADPLAGVVASVALGLATAFVGGHIVLVKSGPYGHLVLKVARFYELLGWPIRGIR